MADEAANALPASQTTGQWAVRWFGLVALALFIAAVPMVHLGWHVVLGHETPPIQTRSQLPARNPAPTRDSLLDGSWMTKKQLYLREASPITWWLRSNWNELLFRLGAPQSDQVHFGRDGWFFIAPSVAPDIALFERAAPLRQQFFRDVRDRVRASGAAFFVMIVPDKARVYADYAFPGGVLPPAKAPVYATLLGELAEAGIPTVDLAAVMAAARVAEPNEDLYFRRDTHWRAPGALAAGRAVATAIEERFGALLSPRRPMEIGGRESIRLIGDLTAMFSIGTVEIPDARGEMRTTAMSFLTESLAELRDYYGVTMRQGDRSLPMYGDDPAAEVLMAGTSFAEENGMKALSFALGRPVRGIVIRGVTALDPLRGVMQELDKGSRPKVVVWEIVERSFFDSGWRAPRL